MYVPLRIQQGASLHCRTENMDRYTELAQLEENGLLHKLAPVHRLLRTAFGYVEWNYIGYHLLINLLSVDAVNYFLQWTFCSDELLACCDPLNIAAFTLPAGLGPCGWLVGHTIAYFDAARGWAGLSVRRHANLLACQFIWFFFEMLTFSHTLEWERMVFYHGPNATSELFGAGHGHPCAERPYFSTWIPIWQDFPYNTAGQLLGTLFVWLRFGKDPARPGATTNTEDERWPRLRTTHVQLRDD